MSVIQVEQKDFQQIIRTEAQKIIIALADKYQFNQKEAVSFGLEKISKNMTDKYKDLIKTIKKSSNPDLHCFARKPTLERCTRVRKKGSDYCASHFFNRKYGRIDENPKPEMIKGNRTKCQLLVKVWEIDVGDERYYTDKNNYLYLINKSKLECVGSLVEGKLIPLDKNNDNNAPPKTEEPSKEKPSS